MEGIIDAAIRVSIAEYTFVFLPVRFCPVEFEASVASKTFHQVEVVGSLGYRGVEDVKFFTNAGVDVLGNLKPKFLKVGFRRRELNHGFLKSGELFR